MFRLPRAVATVRYGPIDTEQHAANTSDMRCHQARRERRSTTSLGRTVPGYKQIKAVTGVSAGHGLDRAARPKGLEPLTF
jgi:hypothetical protein